MTLPSAKDLKRSKDETVSLIDPSNKKTESIDSVFYSAVYFTSFRCYLTRSYNVPKLYPIFFHSFINVGKISAFVFEVG